jgi:anti-sigma28 factor (negative regulator of flagellin synthesis)
VSVAKNRSANRRIDRFCASAFAHIGERSLPPEIREDNLRTTREARVNELRRQYLSGTYPVSAEEISGALIEKHLKR